MERLLALRLPRGILTLAQFAQTTERRSADP